MKHNTTCAFSLPIELLKDIDEVAKDMNITRSALLTALLSIMIKWAKEE